MEMDYRHGGGPQFDMDRLHVAAGPVIDFSVNLNPLGMPDIIAEKWQDLLVWASPYPSIDGSGIVSYYREVLGIQETNILPGNGSTELIYLIPRALEFESTLVISPSYHDYERASVLAGSRVDRYVMGSFRDFKGPGLDELVLLCEDHDSLWIGRPNNPTGTFFPKQDIYHLADMFPEKWFVVDEAFIHFLDDWKSETLMRGPYRPNILVISSLTKFYAMAGLRLGAAIGHEDTISVLRRVKEPWTINGVADRSAPLLATCTDYEYRSRAFVFEEGKRVFSAIREIEGIRPFPSNVNFVLCHWQKTENLDDLLFHLLSRGLYVRDCRNFPGLEDNFFRIGLRMPEENDLLLSALRSFT